MKRLVLRATVVGEMEQVFAGFDRSLFEFLLPPGAKLIRFDGSEIGDLVKLRLPVAGEWISKITASYRDGQQAYFIDEGVKLPIGLRDWTHKHSVYRDPHGSVIEDDIAFSSGNPVLDALLYPIIYIAFAPRRGRYRAYFAKTGRAVG